MLCCFFFFQAEDGIRDADVTGVQTCALPICLFLRRQVLDDGEQSLLPAWLRCIWLASGCERSDLMRVVVDPYPPGDVDRSEERRVGKECRCRGSRYD